MQFNKKNAMDSFWKVLPFDAMSLEAATPSFTVEELRIDLEDRGELLATLLQTQGAQLRRWGVKWSQGKHNPYGTGSPYDVEDFYMDVFEKVTRILRFKPEQFWNPQSGAAFSTWLFKVAFCLFLDKARKLSRQRAQMDSLGATRVQQAARLSEQVEEVEEVQDLRAVAPDDFTRDNMGFVLMFGKADLTNPQWEAFKAKELGLESVKGLAARTGIPEKTIYGQAQQAKSKLQKAARQIDGRS